MAENLNPSEDILLSVEHSRIFKDSDHITAVITGDSDSSTSSVASNSEEYLSCIHDLVCKTLWRNREQRWE